MGFGVDEFSLLLFSFVDTRTRRKAPPLVAGLQTGLGSYRRHTMRSEANERIDVEWLPRHENGTSQRSNIHTCGLHSPDLPPSIRQPEQSWKIGSPA